MSVLLSLAHGTSRPWGDRVGLSGVGDPAPQEGTAKVGFPCMAGIREPPVRTRGPAAGQESCWTSESVRPYVRGGKDGGGASLACLQTEGGSARPVGPTCWSPSWLAAESLPPQHLVAAQPRWEQRLGGEASGAPRRVASPPPTPPSPSCPSPAPSHLCPQQQHKCCAQPCTAKPEAAPGCRATPVCQLTPLRPHAGPRRTGLPGRLPPASQAGGRLGSPFPQVSPCWAACPLWFEHGVRCPPPRVPHQLP